MNEKNPSVHYLGILINSEDEHYLSIARVLDYQEGGKSRKMEYAVRLGLASYDPLTEKWRLSEISRPRRDLELYVVTPPNSQYNGFFAKFQRTPEDLINKLSQQTQRSRGELTREVQKLLKTPSQRFLRKSVKLQTT